MRKLRKKQQMIKRYRGKQRMEEEVNEGGKEGRENIEGRREVRRGRRGMGCISQTREKKAQREYIREGMERFQYSPILISPRQNWDNYNHSLMGQ